MGDPDVILNDATRLGILTSHTSSYTNVMSGGGQDNVNGNLPFSVSAPLMGSSPTTLKLWQGTRTSLTTSATEQIGSLIVNGNPTGDGTEVQITFAAVPEPSTAVLLAAGLGCMSVQRAESAPSKIVAASAALTPRCDGAAESLSASEVQAAHFGLTLS